MKFATYEYLKSSGLGSSLLTTNFASGESSKKDVVPIPMLGAACAGDNNTKVASSSSSMIAHDKKQMTGNTANSSQTLAPQLSMLYGSTSKIVASLSTYPYQVVKSRLQQGDVLQPRENVSSSNTSKPIRSPPKYRGTIDCIIKIWKFEGIFGFFRGAVPSSLRSAPAAGITLLVYEETSRLLRKNDLLRY